MGLRQQFSSGATYEESSPFSMTVSPNDNHANIMFSLKGGEGFDHIITMLLATKLKGQQYAA